jgi:hypothetical protein
MQCNEQFAGLNGTRIRADPVDENVAVVRRERASGPLRDLRKGKRIHYVKIEARIFGFGEFPNTNS